MERENLKQATGYPESKEVITLNFVSGKNYTGMIYYISQVNYNGNYLIYFIDSKYKDNVIHFEGNAIESVISTNSNKIKEVEDAANN